MCQLVEEPHNSVNQYSPNDGCEMLQISAEVKGSLEVQDETSGFQRISKKFADRVSDSMS